MSYYNKNNEYGYDTEAETSDLFGAFDRRAEGDADLEDAQELYATMASQMEYTDSLAQKKENRKLEAVQFVEVDAQKSEEITRKLVDIYGSDSIQVKKWTEQLKKIERYREEQKKAISKRKRQMIIMSALSVIAAAIILTIIIFMLNSTSYYVNQGDYNHIYKKTMLGAPELYRDESVSALVKEGSDLYYIKTASGKICALDVKNDEETEITESSANEFKIIGEDIYYINASDNDTLYTISVNGTNNQKVHDESCEDLNISGSDLIFKEKKSGETKMLDTKTLNVSEV